MAVIFNASNEQVHTQAFGNWFLFKPKQIKIMQDHIVDFLAQNRREDGFIALPLAFEDPNYQTTPEGKAALKSAETEGVSARIKKLMWIVNNNKQSLKNDMRMRNMDGDPLELASDGELEALELLFKYKSAGQDEAAQRVERAKELEKKLGLK